MYWFHGVGDMRWLVVFWVTSFLVLLGLFWLMTLPRKPRSPTRMRRGAPPSPYEPTAPRPSI